MKQTQIVMGMPITITVYGAAIGVMQRAMAAGFDEFRRVDAVFSTYKPESEISRLNRGELELGDASVEVRDILRQCEQLRAKTDGYFDARRPDGLIDPSGLVKGWSIARVATLLERAGLRNFCVEAGGDIVARGHGEHSDGWRVGIRSPLKADEVVKVLSLRDGAVATSGTYERGEHIYDPHTGRPAQEILSITVVAPDIVQADVFATAAFAMGHHGIEWLARQGLEGYQIGHDERAVFTPGLQRHLAAP